MRKKIPRFLLVPLVLLLIAGMVTPCFALDTSIWIDDETKVDTGPLPYKYDNIPANMLENSRLLRSLEYIGYLTL